MADPGHARRASAALPSSRAVLGGLLVALAGLGLYATASGMLDPPRQQALAAAVDLGPGERLSADRVVTIEVDLPEGARQGVLTDRAAVEGAIALGPIAAGELVQRSAVRLAQDAAEPRQEFSFALDRDRAVNGDLVPGDRVDVLVTYGSGTTAETREVLRDAVVRRSGPPTDAALGSTSRITVTLGLPADADLLDMVHATGVGSVTLVRTTGTPGTADR